MMIKDNDTNCRNCNEVIALNFCSNCGQKKYKRIDKKYIWEEIQYTTIHTNKGFLYSLKKIFKNPGATARDFIDGNRVNYYKPIGLAFILSGFSAFISFKILGLSTIYKAYYAKQKLNSELMNDVMSFMASYNSIVMLAFVPFFAILTSLAFRKWGQNYYEHIVMNAFGLAFYTLVSIFCFYPVLFFLRDNPTHFTLISSVSLLVVPLSMIWFYSAFYKEHSLKSIILRVLLIMLLLVIIYIGSIIVFTVLYIIINGPEAMKYLKPN